MLHHACPGILYWAPDLASQVQPLMLVKKEDLEKKVCSAWSPAEEFGELGLTECVRSPFMDPQLKSNYSKGKPWTMFVKLRGFLYIFVPFSFAILKSNCPWIRDDRQVVRGVGIVMCFHALGVCGLPFWKGRRSPHDRREFPSAALAWTAPTQHAEDNFKVIWKRVGNG